MPSISDRLKSLGVQAGVEEQKKPPMTLHKSVTMHLGGEIIETAHGDAYVIETRYPIFGEAYPAPLWGDGSLEVLAAWADESAVSGMKKSDFAFLDIETTGLSGGSGTFAFMVGIAKFEGDEFRLAQFFLREPGEESAQLAAIEQFLSGCKALVTFNGKSFDVPVLNTRYAQYQWPTPLKNTPHLDLLHLARKLWRARLSSRRLGDLEENILNVPRGSEEVPSYLIPQMYFDFLHSGDAEPLKGVFYHNAMDILTMSALMTHIADLLSDPVHAAEHDIDLLSIGKLHEDIGHVSEAKALYLECLGRPLEQDAWLEAAKRLSFVFKRQENWDGAIKLWKTAAGKGEIYAHEELAKYFEHRTKELKTARKWTQSALETVNTSGFPILHRYQWQPELEKRIQRLDRKIKSLENKT
jgi:uncharacterized protein YprB with RNaseH-like and TPR domain